MPNLSKRMTNRIEIFVEDRVAPDGVQYGYSVYSKKAGAMERILEKTYLIYQANGGQGIFSGSFATDLIAVRKNLSAALAVSKKGILRFVEKYASDRDIPKEDITDNSTTWDPQEIQNLN